MREVGSEGETDAKQPPESNKKTDKQEKKPEEERDSEPDTESEETLARRRSIQRWMDENHYA